MVRTLVSLWPGEHDWNVYERGSAAYFVELPRFSALDVLTTMRYVNPLNSLIVVLANVPAGVFTLSRRQTTGWHVLKNIHTRQSILTYCNRGSAIEGELGVSARPTPYCNGPRHTRTQVRRFLTQILFSAQKCVDCNSSGDDDDMATLITRGYVYNGNCNCSSAELNWTESNERMTERLNDWTACWSCRGVLY